MFNGNNAMTKGIMMQNQPATLEVTVEQLKEKIALAELLEGLHRSPGFKKIILKGYFETKAQGLVQLTALPQDERQTQIVKNGMVGISALQQYFHGIYREAEQATADLAEYELALEEDIADGE